VRTLSRVASLLVLSAVLGWCLLPTDASQQEEPGKSESDTGKPHLSALATSVAADAHELKAPVGSIRLSTSDEGASSSERERATPLGSPPPADCIEAVRYLNYLGIEAPQRLEDHEAWGRLRQTVEATRAEIGRLGQERNGVIARIAAQRMNEGRFQRFDYSGQPSTKEEGWKERWPWLEELQSKDHWIHYRTRGDGQSSFVELVKIPKGEVPEIEAVESARVNQIMVLSQDVRSMRSVAAPR